MLKARNFFISAPKLLSFMHFYAKPIFFTLCTNALIYRYFCYVLKMCA